MRRRPVARGSRDRVGEQPAAEPCADPGRNDSEVSQLDIRCRAQVQLDQADLFAVGLGDVDLGFLRREMGRQRRLVPQQPAPPEPVVADRVVEAQVVGGRHRPPAADGDAGERRGRAQVLRRRLHREMGHHDAELAGRNGGSASDSWEKPAVWRSPALRQRPQEMPSSSSMSEPWAARPSSEHRNSAAEAMSSASE